MDKMNKFKEDILKQIEENSTNNIELEEFEKVQNESKLLEQKVSELKSNVNQLESSVEQYKKLEKEYKLTKQKLSNLENEHEEVKMELSDCMEAIEEGKTLFHYMGDDVERIRVTADGRLYEYYLNKNRKTLKCEELEAD